MCVYIYIYIYIYTYIARELDERTHDLAMRGGFKYDQKKGLRPISGASRVRTELR